MDVAETAVRDVLSWVFGQPDRPHAMLVETRKQRARTEVVTPDDEHRELEEAITRNKAAVVRCTDLLLGQAAGTPAERALLDRLSQAQAAIDTLRRQRDALATAKVYALPAVLTRDEVVVFAKDLDRALMADGLRHVLAAVAERHGLVITILDGHRLTVEMDLDLRGTGQPVHRTRSAGPGLTL